MALQLELAKVNSVRPPLGSRCQGEDAGNQAIDQDIYIYIYTVAFVPAQITTVDTSIMNQRVLWVHIQL